MVVAAAVAARLRLISSNADLLPLLELPADDPRDVSASINITGSSNSPTTLLAVLQRLHQQAQLYSRSAAELMDDEQQGADDLAAACLALDLSSLVQDVTEANKLLTSTIAAEKGKLCWHPIAASKAVRDSRGAAAGTSAVAAANPTTAVTTGRKQRSNSEQGLQSKSNTATAGGGTVAATADASAAAAAALDAAYRSALQPHQFVEADLLAGGHYFKKEAQALAAKAAGGEAKWCLPGPPRSCISHIIMSHMMSHTMFAGLMMYCLGCHLQR